MAEWTVTWEIQVDAPTAGDAAREAWRALRDSVNREGQATVLTVWLPDGEGLEHDMGWLEGASNG